MLSKVISHASRNHTGLRVATITSTAIIILDQKRFIWNLLCSPEVCQLSCFLVGDPAVIRDKGGYFLLPRADVMKLRDRLRNEELAAGSLMSRLRNKTLRHEAITDIGHKREMCAHARILALEEAIDTEWVYMWDKFGGYLLLLLCLTAKAERVQLESGPVCLLGSELQKKICWEFLVAGSEEGIEAGQVGLRLITKGDRQTTVSKEWSVGASNIADGRWHIVTLPVDADLGEVSCYLDGNFDGYQTGLPLHNGSCVWEQGTEVVAAWMRPIEIVEENQLFSGPCLFSGAANSSDVCQGRLGDCWFLSAVAVLTEVSQISEVIITPEYNEEGIYTVRFCIQGEWVPVVMDDWIPCESPGKPAFATSRKKNELLVSILEKAYAKLHGSYEALEGVLVQDALVDVTGGAGEEIDMRSTEAQIDLASGRLWSQVLRFNQEGFLLGAGIASGAVAVLLLLAVGLLCAYELCAVYVTAGVSASERYSPSGFFFGVSAFALAINMLFICRMVFNGITLACDYNINCHYYTCGAFLLLYGVALAIEGWGVVASLKIYPPFAGAAVSAITLVVAFGSAVSRPCLTLETRNALSGTYSAPQRSASSAALLVGDPAVIRDKGGSCVLPRADVMKLRDRLRNEELAAGSLMSRLRNKTLLHEAITDIAERVQDEVRLRLFLDSIGLPDLSAKDIKKWLPEEHRRFELIQESYIGEKEMEEEILMQRCEEEGRGKERRRALLEKEEPKWKEIEASLISSIPNAGNREAAAVRAVGGDSVFDDSFARDRVSSIARRIRAGQLSRRALQVLLLPSIVVYSPRGLPVYVYDAHADCAKNVSGAFLLLYGVALAIEGWGVVASLKIYPPFAGAAVSAITLVVAFGFAVSRPCLTLETKNALSGTYSAPQRSASSAALLVGDPAVIRDKGGNFVLPRADVMKLRDRLRNEELAAGSLMSREAAAVAAAVRAVGGDSVFDDSFARERVSSIARRIRAGQLSRRALQRASERMRMRSSVSPSKKTSIHPSATIDLEDVREMKGIEDDRGI
ncbi:unnamed protein product [Cuscuta campestris]|uniref:Calpain catalytic domain-containing protein n=1 Tax=Cuscuta campestris TaxID=132261 RepID=A0A484KHV4_9ASTE|nr:unnamed protein product [Cuscuta campestris]